MKNLYLATIAFIATFLTGCELAGDIFKGGIYVGIFIVIAVVALVFWIISKIRS